VCHSRISIFLFLESLVYGLRFMVYYHNDNLGEKSMAFCQKYNIFYLFIRHYFPLIPSFSPQGRRSLLAPFKTVIGIGIARSCVQSRLETRDPSIISPLPSRERVRVRGNNQSPPPSPSPVKGEGILKSPQFYSLASLVSVLRFQF